MRWPLSPCNPPLGSVFVDVFTSLGGGDVARPAYADHFINSFINAAGVNGEDGSIKLSEEAWDRTFAVNARSTSLCAKYAAAQMKKQDELPSMDRGWIINIAGIQTGSSK